MNNVNPRKTKRLSGAEYRKKKAKREEEIKTLAGSFEKFLKPVKSLKDANGTIESTTTTASGASTNIIDDVSPSDFNAMMPSCSGKHCLSYLTEGLICYFANIIFRSSGNTK